MPLSLISEIGVSEYGQRSGPRRELKKDYKPVELIVKFPNHYRVPTYYSVGMNAILNWKFKQTIGPERYDNKSRYRRAIRHIGSIITGDLRVVKQEYNKF